MTTPMPLPELWLLWVEDAEGRGWWLPVRDECGGFLAVPDEEAARHVVADQQPYFGDGFTIRPVRVR